MEVKNYHAAWRGAVILTMAGLATKILSAFYRIPFQNIVGDVGFYIYQQVYPVYGICLVLATYGFPAVISSLVAEEAARGNEQGIREVARLSFLSLLVFGTGMFTALFFAAPALAAAMGDGKLTGVLRVAAVPFLLLPFLSVGRGAFQGLHDMIPTAASQVTEQAVRVSVIILASLYLLARSADLYTVGAGAMAGSAAGGLAAAAVLLLYRRGLKQADKTPAAMKYKRRQVIQTLFLQGLAVCVSNLVLIFVQFVDSVSLYKTLLEAGEPAQYAKVIKGVYDRGTPLIQLGTVVATSFSLSLIPVIAGGKHRGDWELIRGKVAASMKITLVLGGGAATGLACIIEPTNIMLFEDARGSDVLAVLAAAILFGAFSITAAALLQGLGSTMRPALFVILGAAVKWAGNLWLIPLFGVRGAAYATVLGLLCTAVLNIQFLVRLLRRHVFAAANTLWILAACLGMAAVLIIYTTLFGHVLPAGHRAAAVAEALTAVGLGGIVYVYFILRLPIFTEEELGAVWHGGKLPRLLQRIRKER
ncbi:putative polysaccharide biosynthesis protein [Ectobacillus ponti]|uniref:Polysaccharide biosynthesis protein n=1 Tax=Ectobacillus ponti TaxID=2961894 RepID=A0AA41XFI6_9BACI|nr:polysaccharide biosynthesis protein [Ectobacillus ponti]MCP8971176.1 polysaccharide biosynthesis protein [Ectobacillus ponti]